jgi:4-amino-4-deoxy-L-arabinose transferase-like glycosyltransferase
MLLSTLGGVYLLGHACRYGVINADEGFYAIAARSVSEGKIPYRDFAYTQMPFLPYLNGLWMEIFGFGLLQQRLINASWSLLGLFAVFGNLRRKYNNALPGFVAAFAIVPHGRSMVSPMRQAPRHVSGVGSPAPLGAWVAART